MNTLAKVGAAGALVLGMASAHAAIVVPNGTYNSFSDIMLFGEVLNSTGAVIGSYAGDSGIKVNQNGQTVATGTVGTLSAAADTNLASFLTAGTAAGATIEWAVLGGNTAVGGFASAGDTYLTTAGAGQTASFAGTNGNNLIQWGNGLASATTGIKAVGANAGTANSIYKSGAPVVVSTAGVWDATSGFAGLQNWASNGFYNNIIGLGQTSMYQFLSTGTGNPTISTLGNLTLSATGLTFGTGTTTVPLPAAVWLLGSGLLGLFGVGRRKTAAA